MDFVENLIFFATVQKLYNLVQLSHPEWHDKSA